MNDVVFDFAKKLAYSQGVRLDTDVKTIQALIAGCVAVRKTSEDVDKKGVDYIATLRGGAQIRIDAKTREPGCSQFWRGVPELAPEIWSVMPGGKYNIPQERAKTGWTLSETNEVDYIFCTFAPEDSDQTYMLPFQLYRIIFRANCREWRELYKVAIQDSGQWQSMCLFVPAPVVLNAIYEEMQANCSPMQQDLAFGPLS